MWLDLWSWCSLAYWAVAALVAWKTIQGVPRVGPRVSRTQWPRVSIVIPARNEADHISAALRSKLSGTYPNLEVVCVDDRSTDGTGDIAEVLALSHPRLRVVRLSWLPQGWLGKVHAMQCGLEHSSGEFVLFSDADVHLEPGAMERVIDLAERERADHVTLLPQLTGRGPLLVPAIGALVRMITLAGRLFAVADPKSSAAMGVGAFNLVRREALSRTPGLSWLKMEIADDIGLGVMMKRFGARCLVQNGSDLVSLDFYPSYRAMLRSVEKNGGNPPLTIVCIGCGLLLALEMGFLIGSPIVAALGALLAWGSAAAIARWLRQPVWPALAPMVGLLLLAYGMVRAALLAALRGGVLWRGTLYSVREVRAGARVGVVPRGTRTSGTAAVPGPPEGD